ncbi:TPA: hypothetical protein ACH3X3_012665 [Trebouxia sp. C0006]
MPEPAREFLPSYKFINTELEIIAADLRDLAVNTNTKITFEEAQQAHLHLNAIFRHFILAARAAGHAAATELPDSTPPPTPCRS